MKITPVERSGSPLDPHPSSTLMPAMSQEEITDLIDDVRKNGLQQPIVLYQSKILDGNHRHNGWQASWDIP